MYDIKQLETATSDLLCELCNSAEEDGNKDKCTAGGAIGSVIVNGVTYQIQLAITPDPLTWLPDSQVMFYEVNNITNKINLQ